MIEDTSRVVPMMEPPKNEYGVPTGYVPRVRHGIPPTTGYATTRHVPPDPIQQAVDDYLLMERKARAWDALRENFKVADRQTLVDLMDSYVHPAHVAAPATTR